LCPERVRKPPAGFNWLDHRLVRDGYIDRCSHQAAALYLFLVTVADVQGLSYYSDASLMKRLSMDISVLQRARRNLVQAGLIAYQKPLYQVLALEDRLEACGLRHEERQFLKSHPSSPKPAFRRPQSINEILKQLMEDKV
jgi:hypothetical protein